MLWKSNSRQKHHQYVRARTPVAMIWGVPFWGVLEMNPVAMITLHGFKEYHFSSLCSDSKYYKITTKT